MYGRSDIWMNMDEWMYGCTDSPCILQEFVPSGSLRGRCPKRVSVCLSVGLSTCWSVFDISFTNSQNAFLFEMDSNLPTHVHVP